MTTPSADPVPSKKPQDLQFNAELLDKLLNGSADQEADRLGTDRLTWAGAIALISGTLGIVGKATRADLNGDLDWREGTVGWVLNDGTPENNVVYRKTGAKGSGTWVLADDSLLTAVQVALARVQVQSSDLAQSVFTYPARLGPATPKSGASSTGTATTYVLTDPAASPGIVKLARIYSPVASGASFSVFSKSGSTYTRIGSPVDVVTTVGLNEVPLDLPIAQGQLVGVTIAAEGGLAYNASEVDAITEWTSGVLSGGSFTQPLTFTAQVLELGFEFELSRLDPMDTRLGLVEDSVYQTAQRLGVATPAGGFNAGAATYVQRPAVRAPGVVRTAKIYSAVATRATFSAYTRSAGGVFTRVGRPISVLTAVGLNTFTLDMPVKAGEYLGVTITDNGGMTYIGPITDYWGWTSGTLSGGSFTNAAWYVDQSIQVRFDVETAAPAGRWAGKRLAFFGDSITDNGTWHRTLCPYLGAELALDLAADGTRMDYALTFLSSSSFDNIDAAVIFYGTNNYRDAQAIGTIADATTAGTFYGDTKKVVEQFQAWKPSLRIILVTPLQRTLAPSTGGGPPLIDYVNAIQAVGARYGLPVLDLHRTSGLNAINAAYWTYDGLHPTSGTLAQDGVSITDGQTRCIAEPAKAFFDSINP